MYTKYEQLLNEAKLESFKTKEEVQNWLDTLDIENYTINEDLTVDVKDDVELLQKGLTSIPVQFGTVSGNFDCGNNKLTSLVGGPKEVGGYFDCSVNKLTSLQGSPKEVKGSFYCNDNNLTSLQGCPKEVKGNFDCSANELTSLEGSPIEVNSSFWCKNNKATFTIEDVKSVSKVKGKIMV